LFHASVPRFVSTFRPIPATLDSELFKRSLNRSQGGQSFQDKLTPPYVLLAACRQEQLVAEFVTDSLAQGFFTDTLVKRLCQVALDRVTYSDLIELLPPLVNQHPQCEGNKTRFLFNGKVATSDPQSFTLVEGQGGSLVVKIGSVGGVMVGTEFVVQDQNPHLGQQFNKVRGITVMEFLG
jgi:hypothetical protein